MPQNLILNKNENINIKLPTESHSSINVFTIFIFSIFLNFIFIVLNLFLLQLFICY